MLYVRPSTVAAIKVPKLSIRSNDPVAFADSLLNGFAPNLQHNVFWKIQVARRDRI